MSRKPSISIDLSISLVPEVHKSLYGFDTSSQHMVIRFLKGRRRIVSSEWLRVSNCMGNNSALYP